MLVHVLSPSPSVGRSVGLLDCPVDCGKTADWIWMPFGMMGRLGTRMRQVDGEAVAPRERTFGVDIGWI